MGWNVALVTLMNERLAVGGSYGPDYKEIFEFAKSIGSPSGEGAPIRMKRSARSSPIDRARRLLAGPHHDALSMRNAGAGGSVAINANQMMDIAVVTRRRFVRHHRSRICGAEGAFHQSYMFALACASPAHR